MRLGPRLATLPAATLAALLLVLLLFPVGALLFASSPAELVAGVRDPLFLPALLLSARTSVVSLALVVVMGSPLAWWLATSPSRATRAVEAVVDLPIVVPPAVMGVALLQAYGHSGVLGPVLEWAGVGLPFTTAAVIMAQTVVSAPFYVAGATAAFRRIDLDLLTVARTLGASRSGAFFRVAVPMALPGLLGGAALSWARSLGEFGATLLFAGNFGGRTQTMPLAIYTALEGDVRVALALALVLAGCALIALLALRSLPTAWRLATRRSAS